MKQVRDVLQLHSVMNLSLRRIQGATNVAKSTISDYIKRFNESGLKIEQVNILNDDVLRLKLFPEHSSIVVSKKAMPDMNYLYKEMKLRKKTKITLMLLWEEYREVNPDGYCYSQFRLHYRRYKKKLNPSMRQTHLAGEKLFVDYSGVVMPIHNQRTGEIEYAQIFVAVLGASGYTFVQCRERSEEMPLGCNTFSKARRLYIFSCYVLQLFWRCSKSSSSRQFKKCHHLK